MVAVGKRLVSLIHWAEIKSDEARGTPKRSLLSFPTLGSSFFFFESAPLQTLLFFFSSLGYFLFSSLFFFFPRASLFFEFQVERRDRFTLRTARLTRVGDRVQSRVQQGERGVSSV